MAATRPPIDRAFLRSWSGIPQAIGHQAGWWACVIWMGWQGPLAMALFLGVHAWCTRTHWRSETKLVAASALVGIVLDNALAMGGFVEYEGSITVGWTPLWLVGIWAGFGATLRHSQRVLVASRRSALLTGSLGGPLAYWGGERLERLTVDDPAGWLAVSLTWTVALWVLQHLAASNGPNAKG